MSSIFNRLVRVSALTIQRPGLVYQKWCKRKQNKIMSSSSAKDETSHYQHGIPGIPTDGKVVLLKNSNTGSQLYLVGISHISKHSPKLVKKVVNSIRPDAIAIQYSEERIEEGMEELRSRNRGLAVNVNEDWFCMLLRSIMSPGGLQHKMGMFINNWKERRHQVQGDAVLQVALEESLKLKVKLVPIAAGCPRDDFHVSIPGHIYLGRKIRYFIELNKISTFVHLRDKHSTSRSMARVVNRLANIDFPEYHKWWTEDTEIHMVTMLRGMEEKLIVAVVGFCHMDGIERFWKRAEDAGNDRPPLATSENGGP